jgi:hypothetical protein
MTLYRTGSQSHIIQYLIDAAKNGKQVAVVVEQQARFDESANIKVPMARALFNSRPMPWRARTSPVRSTALPRPASMWT